MPDGLIDLIIEVVTSWQVIFIAIAFFIFASLVSTALNPPVAKERNHGPRKLKRPKVTGPAPPDKSLNTDDIDLGE